MVNSKPLKILDEANIRAYLIFHINSNNLQSMRRSTSGGPPSLGVAGKTSAPKWVNT